MNSSNNNDNDISEEEESTSFEASEQSDHILGYLDAEFPDDADKRIAVLENALFRANARAGVKQEKQANGTQGEKFLARKIGLVWERDEIHGVDAHDEYGNPCEIKAASCNKTKLKATGGYKMNFNYVPPRRKPDESKDVYLQRVLDHYLKITGGHYWGLYNVADDKVYKWWVLPCEGMAHLITWYIDIELSKKPDQRVFHFNFGAKTCSRLRDGTIMRVLYIQEQLLKPLPQDAAKRRRAWRTRILQLSLTTVMARSNEDGSFKFKGVGKKRRTKSATK